MGKSSIVLNIGNIEMNPALYLIPLLAVAVYFLIRSELRGNRRQVYFIKPVSTLLVILAALQAVGDPLGHGAYTFGVITGLVFSLGGDIALMFDNKKSFRTGLVLFLLAHIAYAAVFTMVGSFSGLSVISALVLALVGLGIYWLIQAGLGSMKIPVIAYILIISVMTIQAVSVFATPGITGGHASMIVSGALLFYISDVILAVNRFWRPWKYHRISLAFYYSGQMLIALSAGCFVSAV